MKDSELLTHCKTYVACCALCFVARCANLVLDLPEFKICIVLRFYTVSKHQEMEVRIELEKVLIVKTLG
jgi:hypothetical protein